MCKKYLWTSLTYGTFNASQKPAAATTTRTNTGFHKNLGSISGNDDWGWRYQKIVRPSEFPCYNNTAINSLWSWSTSTINKVLNHEKLLFVLSWCLTKCAKFVKRARLLPLLPSSTRLPSITFHPSNFPNRLWAFASRSSSSRLYDAIPQVVHVIGHFGQSIARNWNIANWVHDSLKGKKKKKTFRCSNSQLPFVIESFTFETFIGFIAAIVVACLHVWRWTDRW